MTPSDGLPDPSSSWTAQYGPSTCPLPAGSVQSSAAKAHPESWVKGSSRWISFQQEAPSTPMPRAAVASSKANGMKREWCPGSLESPATLRRSGRTETLTGQASHTSSRAKGSSKEQKERGRNIGAANGGKELNLARSSCCEVRSLLALLTLRSGSWFSGIRICTAAFRRRIPIGDGLLSAQTSQMTLASAWAAYKS